MTDDLPVIDPQKVSLQIPSEIVGGGFEVVNKGAPVVGELIQRTAERLVDIGASLKPLLGFSLGFGGANNGNYKRETGAFDDKENKPEQENQESIDFLVTEEAPSQFKRMVDPSDKPAELNHSDGAETPDGTSFDEEVVKEKGTEDKDKEDVVSTLLAKRVIEKLIEKQIEQELTRGNDDVNQVAESSPQIVQIKRETLPSAVPTSQQNMSNLQTPTYQSIETSKPKGNNLPSYQTTGNNLPSFQTPGNNLPSYQTTGNNLPSYQTTGNNLPSYQTPSEQLQYQPLPQNPYINQQYRNYNPHVKRQATLNEYFQYQNLQRYPQWYPQVRNQNFPRTNYPYGY